MQAKQISKCPTCGESDEGRPATHNIESHEIKTRCFECPECLHCEVVYERFEDHMGTHVNIEMPGNLLQLRVSGLTEFTKLHACEHCRFWSHSKATVEGHVDAVHAHPEVFLVSKGESTLSVSSPPWFNVVSTEEREAVKAARRRLKQSQQELVAARKEHDRVVKEPDVFGVAHSVSLRGDVANGRSEACFHVFMDAWLAPGAYRLFCGANPSVLMFCQYHPYSPIVDPASRGLLVRNLDNDSIHGLLHAVRGDPVVWFDMWFGDMLCDGVWKVCKRGDSTHASAAYLTVKKSWVYE